MHPFLLRDQKFMNNVIQMGMEITPHLNNPNTSPQQLLNNFSEWARSLAQKQSKIKIGIIKSKIKKLENTRDILINKANSLENNEQLDTLNSACTITTKIQESQTILFNHNQKVAKANRHLYGEMINKFWCATGKEKKGWDTITELRLLETNPAAFSTNSAIMANKMATYHRNLQ